ncbi:uncharacterized protein LOC124957390 isoform X5 [Vespa velutina]|uniref:uncharacterized protein LOC124957390 isoform X5 n=1 Tax=Vespa velutina TaxID=202808 RepID=UPI001FB56053|nr:uncharacterized protein LOC124957390 isoform X5 [Vespa velutina]
MKFLPLMIKIKPRITQNHVIKKSILERRQHRMRYAIFDGTRKSTYRAELYRSVLIAKPDHACFHNFQKNILYRKTIILTNISNTSTKFQIQPISRHSKFIVRIQNKKLERNFIAPGMQLKLIISFYTEDLYEEEEIITIYVQHGRPINIKLQCIRDPPTLKRIIIPHLLSAESEINNLYSTESTTVSSNSCITEVDTFYIVTDNYSVKSFELIGDGIMYEPQTFQINSQSEGTYLSLTKIDMESVVHYDLNIQRNFLKEFQVITKKISITNTSQMYMFFRWEKCSVKVKEKNEIEDEIEGENDDENFLDYFYIIPESGIFFASVDLNFNIVITIPSINLPDGHIYGLLQLYIEDIPQAAISKSHKLWTIESQTKRRVCTTNSVDILVADIKLIQTLYYDASFKKKSDEYNDKDILEIDISQSSIKKDLSDIDLKIYSDQKSIIMPALVR